MYFEVKNNNIEKKIAQQSQLEHMDSKICYFKFTTKEWAQKEKYVIFWTEKNKTIIKSLGKKCKSKIKIPKELNPKSFIVQVYVNDDLKTNKYTIGALTEEKEVNKCSQPSNKTMDLIQKIYDDLDLKIDNVFYSNNILRFYANNEIVKTIDLVDEKLIEKVLKGKVDLNVDSKLSLESRNPVQNKVITKELEKKQDSSTLPKVAQTGDYNDLNNIPNNFTPSQHMHTKDDLINFDYNVDEDIEIILIKLTDDILGM